MSRATLLNGFFLRLSLLLLLMVCILVPNCIAQEDTRTALGFKMTANGKPAPKIIPMGQKVYLFEVEGDKYKKTDMSCPVSPGGMVEFLLPSGAPENQEYAVQVFLNGNQAGLYSPVAKEGLHHWDIRVAEIQIDPQSDIKPLEGDLVVLYEGMRETDFSSQVLAGGKIFFPIMNDTFVYKTGFQTPDFDIYFSPALKAGMQNWLISKNTEDEEATEKLFFKEEHKIALTAGPRFLSAVWANNGEDKITQDELRSSQARDVLNSVWDGVSIKLFGAQNEIVAFNLILEAAREDVRDVWVKFDSLSGPDGAKITSRPVSRHNLFNFVGRNIELFYVRYLQIRGVGRLLYMPDYDERHVPERLRLPYSLPKGKSRGKFEDRPDANKFYPDIAVPLEAVQDFDIDQGTNQSVWVDIYIPKESKPGNYKGSVKVYEGDKNAFEIPVELEVLDFSLPDQPTAKTMVYYSDGDINGRYYGRKWPEWNKLSLADQKRLDRIWFNHHKVAQRHKISLIDDGLSVAPDTTRQNMDHYTERWLSVFTGKLFSPQNGYAGPGVGVSGGVYSIGTYGNWRRTWKEESKIDMWKMSDLWVNWFSKNAPQVEYFLYLLDEPKKESYKDVERWARWIDENKGSGSNLKTLATTYLPQVDKSMPSLDIAFTGWGDKAVWEPVVRKYRKEGKEIWAYNGWRPSTGSFSTEDDGVALRVIGWTHFKHKVARWFYWQSTCYKNPSHVSVETNVFRTAWTFGRKWDTLHRKYGETGNNYSNGDGVLFYPGTEKMYPQDNYGLDGPIASLRLKHWRRGIQDVEYLSQASKYAPDVVKNIVQGMIPKVLWEVGVTNPKDPTYVHTDISWSTDPDLWEAARRILADIIINKGKK